MPQSSAQRKYWASRRQNERAVGNQVPKPHRTVLLATSVDEYHKLKGEYPNMPVKLRTDGTQQQLFNTGGFKDV